MSISLDPDDAERIRGAADRAAQDISRYVVQAALDAVERDERAARNVNVFSEIDARIDAMEHAAHAAPWPPPPLADDLSPAEQAAIVARWDAFFGETKHGAA